MKILVDSREQKPWAFEDSEVVALPTGDYAPAGLQHIFTIERKGSVAELARNLVEDRFERELARMVAYEHAHVICEFTLDDLAAYPKGSGLPARIRAKVRTTGRFLLKRLKQLQEAFPNVSWHFAGEEGRELALEIMREMADGPAPAPALAA